MMQEMYTSERIDEYGLTIIIQLIGGFEVSRLVMPNDPAVFDMLRHYQDMGGEDGRK